LIAMSQNADRCARKSFKWLASEAFTETDTLTTTAQRMLASIRELALQFHNAAMHRSGRLALHGKSSSLPVVPRPAASVTAAASAAPPNPLCMLIP
jgi:hypothetical protein